MRFRKRLNNNVVVAVSDSGDERILFGRGLGYGVEKGDLVDESLVERVFVLQDQVARNKLADLLDTISVDYIEVAQQVYEYAESHLTVPVSDNVIVHLADHMHMAVQREREGAEIKNMMLQEIQRFYQEEFRVGEYAAQQINARFGTSLAEDEAGFIALHVVNAQLHQGSRGVSLTRITQAIQDIERIVRMRYTDEIDITTDGYRRFMTHLKFFVERLFSENQPSRHQVGKMLDTVREAYPQASDCVASIDSFLRERYSYELTDDESLYLTIHVAHMTTTPA